MPRKIDYRKKHYGEEHYGLKLRKGLTKLQPGDILSFNIENKTLSVSRNGEFLYWNDERKLYFDFINEEFHFASIVDAILLPHGFRAGYTDRAERLQNIHKNHRYFEVIE